jgi:hypothetical protein
MGTIKDYINWRGDLEFWQDGFNVVDNLVLSCVSYVEMDSIFDGDAPKVLSIKEVSDIYFEKIYDEDSFRDGSILKDSPITLKAISQTKRYKDVKIRNYINLIDTSRTLQFAAMEFLLPDGTSYICYRGTDDTVVGWKEDFMLAIKETEAEKEAVNYINRIAKDNDRLLRVGGHSKGGHLSVFAAAKCNKDIQQRILTVYSNDGPGFMDKVASSKAIKDILPMIISIVPEETIVGLLMTPVCEPIVVKSNAVAVLQHNIATWCVEGKSLVTAENISKAAVMADKWIKDSIAKMTEAELDNFVEELFSIFEAAGALTLTDFKKGGLKSLKAISQTVKAGKKK